MHDFHGISTGWAKIHYEGDLDNCIFWVILWDIHVHFMCVIYLSDTHTETDRDNSDWDTSGYLHAVLHWGIEILYTDVSDAM